MGFNTGKSSSSQLMEDIKFLMRTLKLTQKELAHELGYSRKVINRQLNNDDLYKKDYELILKICKRLGITTIVID